MAETQVGDEDSGGATVWPPELFRQGDLGALANRMRIELLAASPERVVGRMPVDGNTQPYGLLHGGASCVLAETLGSTAAALWAGEGRYAVGVDINATHHRSAVTGHVTGEATALHRGRTTATYAISLRDDSGDLVCTVRLTCALRDHAPRD